MAGGTILNNVPEDHEERPPKCNPEEARRVHARDDDDDGLHDAGIDESAVRNADEHGGSSGERPSQISAVPRALRGR